MPKVNTSEDEWKQKLTAERYAVLRQKGTEAPFSGALLNNHDEGRYTCAACGQELFNSDTKFESGSGWPSFYDAIPGTVEYKDDSSLGVQRTEITCSSCGSHLGHIFDDAHDQPTGQRYCVNSLSLNFKKEGK